MRARNIKPGFFNNEKLVECEPLARILFAGLWCLADKRGRLKDRPTRIRIEILPCDSCDPDALLKQLEHFGFIHRYEVAGERLIKVVNFEKHQRPHKKEKESELPGPEDAALDCRVIPGKIPGNSGESTSPLPEKVGESPGIGQVITRPDPPDSLIPDPLIPEPSLNSDSRERAPKHDHPPSKLMRLSFEYLPPDWSAWTQSEMGWSAEVMQDVWISFRDYWQSRTGKSAQKSDWGVTWRNWCRQQNIRNGGKHATTLNHTAQGARPSKSERFKHALIDSTCQELGT